MRARARKDEDMKRVIFTAIGALLVFGVSIAAAQSLGDVARASRKGKAPAKHQYDNDNLPKSDKLSVVGPAPAVTDAIAANPEDSSTGQDAQAAPPQAQPPEDPKAAAEERQRAAQEWKDKIEDQKQKVDSLSHELDLTQREYRLRAVAMYSDAGNRLRNATEWDKEDRDYKQQLDARSE